MITICLTYFKSLTLANLEAALWSVRQQDLSNVEQLVVFNNDTRDSITDIVTAMNFPLSVRAQVVSSYHGDKNKAHAWSTNQAVDLVTSPWVLFTRADYLLRFDLLTRFSEVVREHGESWNGFVVGNGCHLANVIEDCELTPWRTKGPQVFDGAVFDYTKVDAGVWMARKDAFDRVGGMDESMSAWGHSQTEFQWRMHKVGTEFVRIPETMFWHPFHGGERDMAMANAQLEGKANLREMWERYEGVSPY